MFGSNPNRIPVRSLRFPSATEASRHLLQDARTPTGRFVPVTAVELTTKLAEEGFLVSERDAEGLLRELAQEGDVVEIDAAAGFRWRGHAA